MEFIKERNIFVNEVASGSYTISAYFASKLALDLPLMILQPIIENTLTFWVIGYTNTWETYFKILLVYFLNMQVGTSIGYLASAFAKNESSVA
jgi:ATP-binding cassette subfamily G (WHITE) protein 1